MARKRKYQTRLNWIVILLVSAVVAFCILGTLQDKYDMELGLPDIELPSLDVLDEYIDSFWDDKTGGRDHMDNAVSVSGPVTGDGVTVHIQNMGQADSILIQAPGATVLIDAGENNQGGQVLRYLEQQGVESIDILIGTHPHSDHIGGMDTVIESGIPVGRIIMPELPDDIVPTTATYTDLLEAIDKFDVTVDWATPGTGYDLGGGARLTVVGPREDYNDLNSMSVVSRLDYGDVSFLFCGDTTAQSEAPLVREADISVDILHVPHHGSNTSSSEIFLDAASPSVALISCGLDNSYGHPHREIVERLAARSVEIYRTDLMGTIVVSTDGEDYYITTEK